MMPLPRFAKLPASKQRAILAAATAEFAARGFDDASYNQIIARSGVSKGAMYYYFADKADLYGAVCDHALDRIAAVVADLEPPASAEGFWDRLGEGVARLIEVLVADEELGALARDFYRRGPTATVQALHGRVHGWVEAVLAHGQRVGAVRDDLPRDLLAASVTGMLVAVDRWFADAMMRLPPERNAALAGKMFELVRDLLDPRTSGVA